MDTLMSLNAEHLFRCRVVIGRLGEMDAAGWWNTNGVLGPLGAAALRRNFNKSHWFAQARAVFAVAAARCQEVFSLPQDSVSLWHFPPEIEDEIHQRWPDWLKENELERWKPFFEEVSHLQERDPTAALLRLGLADEQDAEAVRRLRRSHELRSVLVPSGQVIDDRAVALLSLAFSLAEPGKLAVPYMRWNTEQN